MSQPAGDDHPLLTRRWFLSEAGLAGAALAVLGPSAIGCSGAQPEAPAEPDKSPSPPVDEPVAKEPEAAS
ncbi:MAG: twin-arginine translocation signal domain-containing protein, partial [Nannocystaceae bacterium]